MMDSALSVPDLTLLEKQASDFGLLLRIQVRRPFNFWALRLVVAEPVDSHSVRILGEMKAWAYGGVRGLQLDTIQIKPNASKGIGDLVWAATMSWALENTPCQYARLLAVCDDDLRHARLVRYFRRRGFLIVREVGASPMDLPIRMVWGGAGTLMTSNCKEVFERSYQQWHACIHATGNPY